MLRWLWHKKWVINNTLTVYCKGIICFTLVIIYLASVPPILKFFNLGD